MSYIELLLNSVTATQNGGLDRTVNANLNNPKYVVGRHLQSIASLKVVEVEVPFSYYVINDGLNNITGFDNLFQVIWGVPPNFALNGAIAPFTIPPGTYTGPQLAAEIQSLLNADPIIWTTDPNVPFTGPVSWSVTYSPTTGKFDMVFSTGANNGYTMLILFPTTTTIQPLTTTLGYVPTVDPFNLGHQQVVATFSNVGGHFYSFLATNVALTEGPTVLYICSQTLGGIMKAYIPESALGTTGQGNPQICQFSPNGNFGELLTWQDPVLYF